MNTEDKKQLFSAVKRGDLEAVNDIILSFESEIESIKLLPKYESRYIDALYSKIATLKSENRNLKKQATRKKRNNNNLKEVISLRMQNRRLQLAVAQCAKDASFARGEIFALKTIIHESKTKA